jgi:hypothetical protein
MVRRGNPGLVTHLTPMPPPICAGLGSRRYSATEVALYSEMVDRVIARMGRGPIRDGVDNQ